MYYIYVAAFERKNPWNLFALLQEDARFSILYNDEIYEQCHLIQMSVIQPEKSIRVIFVAKKDLAHIASDRAMT